MKERLHKFLAHAGVASRRRAEDLIREGLVAVNGTTVREMGFLVDPGADEVRFDGEIVRAEPPVYWLVNKPAGVLCTTGQDRRERRTVVSLLREARSRRLFTVGRLDQRSEGLIIVTNDGDFADLIGHPRSSVSRTYYLKLTGAAGDAELRRVAEGLWLPDGRTPPLHVHLLHRGRTQTTVLATLHGGSSQSLRRAFARVGHNVLRLSRVQIGAVRADGIKRGEARRLTPAEVASLRSEAEARRGSTPSRPPGTLTRATPDEKRPWRRAAGKAAPARGRRRGGPAARPAGAGRPKAPRRRPRNPG